MTRIVDKCNIGEIEIILSGVSVNFEIFLTYAPVHLMRANSPQSMEKRR